MMAAKKRSALDDAAAKAKRTSGKSKSRTAQPKVAPLKTKPLEDSKGSATDIARPQQGDNFQALMTQLLERLGRIDRRIDAFKAVTNSIRDHSGMEAVGIRLREGDDFPYFFTSGFPPRFVQAENSLCAKTIDGETIRDEQGKPCLECMCGNVLSGRTDPSQDFFTAGGSFWTNSTTRLLAQTAEASRGGHTRNRCNTAGYESVALVPILANEEIIGLLQLNDSRENCLTPEMIPFLEQIGASIGIVLKGKWAEEEMFMLAKFPSENPNPVLRISRDGMILYANAPSRPLLNFWECEVQGALPAKWRQVIRKTLRIGHSQQAELECSERVFSLTFAPVMESDYVNVYALDITEGQRAEEAIRNLARFPSENPSPVLRVSRSGVVLYSNRASTALLKVCRDDGGQSISRQWHRLVLDALDSGQSHCKDIECEGHVFAVTFAPVVDAGYVNIYALDVTERNRAEEALRRARDQLEIRVRKRTEELAHTVAVLEEEVRERRRLELEVLRIGELERHRVGRDLHDGLGQTLTGIACLGKVLHRKLAAKAPDESEDAAKIESIALKALNSARFLASGLSPIEQRSDGLMAALKELSLNVTGIFSITCTFKCDDPVLVDNLTVAQQLYRIAQEAITNAAKHGKASSITLRLEGSHGGMLMTVTDDGIGLPDELPTRSGIGLQTMRYRADSIGAEFSVEGGPTGGTSVSCRVPMERLQ